MKGETVMYQTPISKISRSVKPHRMSVLIAAATVWAATLHTADATPPIAFEINAPPQSVIVGETLGVFEARVVICADNQADGFVDLFLRDGTALELTPVSAKLHFREGSDAPTATIVYLPTRLDGPAQPHNFVFGTAAPSPTEVGCDLWDLLASGVQGGLLPRRFQFEAEVTRTRMNGRCELDDFGQFSSRVKIETLRQTVSPFDGSDPFDFEAVMDIRNNAASGVIDVPLSERGGLYDIFFLAIVPHAQVGFQIFGAGVLSEPGDPLSTDDMMRLRVFSPPPATNGCLFWDLVNGSTGEVRNAATFTSLDDLFKVSPPPKGFGFINP